MIDDNRDLIAFLATLCAIVLLSKIGGTGADLAIMTGLVGVLGGLAASGRNRSKKVQIDQPADDPVPVKEEERP